MIVLVLILLIVTIILFIYMKNNLEKFSGYYVKETGQVGDVHKLGRDVQLEELSDDDDLKDNHFFPLIFGKRIFNPGDIPLKKGSDYLQQKCTECGEGQFVAVTCGVESDRECQDLTECQNYDKQYIDNTDIVKNRFGQRMNDNTCLDIISSCKEYEDIKRAEGAAKKYDRGTCERKGDIVVKMEISGINSSNLFLKKKIYEGRQVEFDSVQKIKNYFSSLKTTEDKYNKYLNKSTEFYFAMDKTNIELLDNNSIEAYYKTYDNIVSYLFDLRQDVILQEFLRNHLYLEISFIERITKIITGPLYLFVMGTETDNNSLMKLYNADNIVFALVYKDQNSSDEHTKEYKYDILKYDLNLFYEYNKEVAISKFTRNINSLKYFLRTTLFKTLAPNYKYQIYDKNDSVIDISITAFLEDDIELNITQTEQSITRCDFKPKGETLFGCKSRCNAVDRCSNFDCRQICEGCNNENCLWTIRYQINKDLLAPENVVVKGFAGDKLIKLTWMKPYSPSIIDKYYILVSSPIDNEMLDIYSVQDHRDLCEYIISDLENDKPYDIYIIVKNDIGISEKSNKVTVVPSINSELRIDTNDSYSNSIENYYKQKVGDSFNLKKSLSSFERKSIINDLKNIIKKELKINIPTESYNINVF